jgi:hypothetical protein
MKVPAMKHPRLNVSAISGACLLRFRKLGVVALGKFKTNFINGYKCGYGSQWTTSLKGL